MAVVRNLMVRAGADFSGMRKEMNKANQSVNKFKKNTLTALKYIASAYAVKKVVGYGRASVQAYNDAAVEAAKLERVMRNTMGATDEQIKSVKELAKAQQGIGVVHTDIQMAGAQELGTYLSEANSLKTLLPTLNDMLAQQYGLDATAQSAVNIGTMIGKVMDGQLGALSRYGYSWTDAQERMLKFGTEAQRAATLADVIGQSVGGMNAALAKTPQGQMKQLAMTFADVKAQIGQGILPILQRILPYIQAVANSFLRAAQFVSAFTSALFGSGNAAKQTMAQANAVGQLGDAYEEAGKQAKGAVGGFDQVNLVGGSTNSEDTGLGLADGLDMGGGFDGLFDGVGEQMSDVAEKAREMADKVREAYGVMTSFIEEHSDIIVAALAGVGVAIALAFGVAKWGSVVATVKAAGSAIGAVLAAIGWPIALAIAAIAALVAGFVYLYRTNEGFKDTIWMILAKIGEVAVWLWNSVLIPLGHWLGTVFVAAWEGVKIAAEWLWENVLVPFGDFLKWLWVNVLIPIGNILKDVLGVAFEFVSDVAKDFWKKVLIPLGQALKEMFAPAVEALSAVLKFLWDKVLKPLGTYLGGVFKGILLVIISVFEFLWHNVLKPLVTFVGGVLKSVFSNAFSAIGDVIGGIKNIFIGLMSFITGVFTGDWKRAWEGVKQIFKGIFDGLWGIIKFPLNMIIDGINALIGGINNFSIDVPDWLAKLAGFAGGGTIGFNIPKIPKLAKGGLAFGPTLAVVGDNRGAMSDPEVIAPLSKLEAMMGGKDDNKEVVRMLERVERAVKDIQSIQAVISASEVTRTAISGIKDITRREGRNPVMV